jgi:Recombination endonuclease VII
LSDFYAAAGTRDGYRLECKACNLAARARKYRENPRPAIERTTQWQRQNPERVRATMDRFRAAGKKKISDRKSHLKRNYGLTLEAFEALLASQGGGCAICGRPDADNVDHDHGTGRVRGILCFQCNVAIGLLRDSEERARSATAYISRDVELDAVARDRAGALSG